MDQTERSSPSDNVDVKLTFRKPSNDAANRKYRRRSPVDGSPSSDGSPEHGRRPSPVHSREASGIDSEHQERRDNKKELDGDTGRNHHGRSSDWYKHDRHSSKSSHRYSKHEDYSRHERHTDEGDRKYQTSPTRSSKDSRSGYRSDYRRQIGEHRRPRDYTDRYSHDKHSGSGYRSHDKERDIDPSSGRVGSGRRHADLTFEGKDKERRARDGDRLDEKKESHRSLGDHRSDQAHARDVRRKYEDSETKKETGFSFKAPKDRHEGKNVFGNEDQGAPAKKLKLLSSEKFTDGENGAEEKQSLSSKPAVVAGDEVYTGQFHSSVPGISGDVGAAKVAAMKAAELVNKNLVGTGYLTTDQKKKLLWGNKKSMIVEEPAANRWGNVLVGDPDRQEKFNKLMGVKGNLKTEQKQSNDQDIQAEKQMELQADLEKQYTAGLRRRDGRTVGIGL